MNTHHPYFLFILSDWCSFLFLPALDQINTSLIMGCWEGVWVIVQHVAADSQSIRMWQL